MFPDINDLICVSEGLDYVESETTDLLGILITCWPDALWRPIVHNKNLPQKFKAYCGFDSALFARDALAVDWNHAFSLSTDAKMGFVKSAINGLLNVHASLRVVTTYS